VKWALVICVALASACKDRELAKLSAVRDRVCACKTVQCAEGALADVPKGKVESTPKSQRVAREMLDCLAELYELDRPTLDPDAEAPPH
jgi:hypothetical protein